MSKLNWKHVLGERLRQLRLEAHGGKGYTQQEAATTIRRTLAYINRLEIHMEGENPSMDMLEQLCNLYGRPMSDLFAVLIDTKEQNSELKEKLDFILSSGVERTMVGITENIHAMYERTKSLKKR